MWTEPVQSFSYSGCFAEVLRSFSGYMSDSTFCTASDHLFFVGKNRILPQKSLGKEPLSKRRHSMLLNDLKKDRIDELKDELHQLEMETFEIEDIADIDIEAASCGCSSSCSTSSCCSCSTSSCCSCSTSCNSTA